MHSVVRQPMDVQIITYQGYSFWRAESHQTPNNLPHHVFHLMAGPRMRLRNNPLSKPSHASPARYQSESCIDLHVNLELRLAKLFLCRGEHERVYPAVKQIIHETFRDLMQQVGSNCIEDSTVRISSRKRSLRVISGLAKLLNGVCSTVMSISPCFCFRVRSLCCYPFVTSLLSSKCLR